MFRFIRHLKNVIDYMRLPSDWRRLTFYSEGQNYWPHLEGLIKEVLSSSNIKIAYVTSNSNDPGLTFDHPNFCAFEIDEGFIRNWFFENIQTDVMVMTMPDLHQYQVKRSQYEVHYVYTQHSLVSLHMVYRNGAFDFYDTIFCSGPHHIAEMRAIEKEHGLAPKNLVEHGYARLDSIVEEARRRNETITKEDGAPLHALIAPSWGENATIESGIGKKIVERLLTQGFKVTLRPHPQTFIFFKNMIDEIANEHFQNTNFNLESNVAGQDSLHACDFMVSDWSGAALDFAFGLDKPVIFVDVPRKVNNLKYEDIKIEPFEVSIRETIGSIIKDENTDFTQILSELEKDKPQDYSVFNLLESNKIGANYLISLCEEKNYS